MTDSAIVLEGVVRDFGATRAIDGLTFDVRHGEVMGLLGHNGSGKTTTVRVCNGVLRRQAGTIRVLGLDPETHGEAVRAQTGVLTESPAVDERFTGRENLAFFAALHRLDDAGARVDAALQRVGLLDVKDARAGTFSKGMKQKLAIARALLHEPRVLYLDEPTSGLDPVASKALVDTVRRLPHDEGRAVVFCTHRLAEAEELCDRVVVVAKGRLVAIGAPHELAERLAPQRAAVEVEVAASDVERAVQIATALFAGAPDLAGEPGTARAPDAGSAPGIVVAPRHGGATLVVERMARADVPRLTAALVGAGVALYRIGAVRARLEDASFALADQAPDAASSSSPAPGAPAGADGSAP